VISKKQKKVLIKKYYEIMHTIFQNDLNPNNIKGKFLTLYLCFLSILLLFVMTSLYLNAKKNKLLIDIKQLQNQKINLTNIKNKYYLEISNLSRSERIIEEGKKIGLILPDKEVYLEIN